MNFLALLVFLTKGRRRSRQDAALFVIAAVFVAVETPVSESRQLVVLRAARRGSIIGIDAEGMVPCRSASASCKSLTLKLGNERTATL